METNISLAETDFFLWDVDGTMWSSFNTSFAFKIYKWIIFLILVNSFQIIFLLGPLIWMILYTMCTALLPVRDLLIKFNKGYSTVDDNAERNLIMKYFLLIGSIIYDHELFGLENVPDGPAIFYVYHGTVAPDGIFVGCKIQLAQTRTVYFIAHKKEANLYGYRRAHRAVNYCALTREDVIDKLKNEDCQIVVAVGGVEESRISDNNYRVYLGKRQGIAHIAKATNVPIIPVFTRNIQEAFWIPWFAKPFIKFCSKEYLTCIPSAGGLPVKLTSYIGKEIEYDSSWTPEELMNTFRDGMQSHIDQHQIVPGNKLRALRERFCSSRHKSTDSSVA